MAQVKLSISADDQHLNDFEKFVKGVEKAGLKVKGKHKDIGVVTGAIDKDKVESLRKVKGVAQVEEEREIQLPPPESDIQ
ncbi:MAG TPA: hypothetical protein VFH31_20135 [Pyrinomonadaceae bacterium]|nr:hypothetical protein [Pyrinomonadaceae bacterium]